MTARYCYEWEKSSYNRHIGPSISLSNALNKGVYVIYDKRRGLYDEICYVMAVEDAERIVRLLNEENLPRSS